MKDDIRNANASAERQEGLYDTIRYDSGYLTCSKKLTGSQLSLPHGTNKNKNVKLKIK